MNTAVVQIRMRKISLTQPYDTLLPGELCSLRDKGKKLLKQVLLHFSFGGISTARSIEIVPRGRAPL